MTRIKDDTPILEGDVALSLREERKRRGLDPISSIRTDAERESVDLITEERMARKRARYDACEPVALEILEEARRALAVRFRFLDGALWRMPLVSICMALPVTDVLCTSIPSTWLIATSSRSTKWCVM